MSPILDVLPGMADILLNRLVICLPPSWYMLGPHFHTVKVEVVLALLYACISTRCTSAQVWMLQLCIHMDDILIVSGK